MVKSIRMVLLVMCLAGLQGCITPSIVSTVEKGRFRDNQEHITQFLMTEDGKQLVILGKQHHYIFDSPYRLTGLLASPLRAKVRPTFGRFSVDDDARVTGEVCLVMDAPASIDEQVLVRQLGFTPGASGNWSMSLSVTGTRYSARNFTPAGGLENFNQEYQIKVREPVPFNPRNPLLLLTPVTVAADGALMLAAVVLSPIWVPVVISSWTPKIW